MDKKNITGFPKKHPILFHLLLIAITLFVVLYGVLFAIDSFTGHGVYVVVPDVKGKVLTEAVDELAAVGFKYEVTDSAYNDNSLPGTVIDQEPKAASKVKPLRTVYLTMNATSPRLVTVPSVIDMSCRQGMAMLLGLGFKNVKVDTVYSPYKDLILSVKANGNIVNSGSKLPLTAAIEISIGNGMEEVLPDSIADEFADSVAALPVE